MPEVSVGEWVLYKPGPNSVAWSSMYVTQAYDNNINGTLIERGDFRVGSGDLKINVIHADDPRLEDPIYVRRMIDEGDQGVFVLHPVRLRMEARITRLEDRIAKLDGKGRGKGRAEPEVVETEEAAA
jgi:hypothetical protein